jgi:hypothetical protein
MVIERRHRPAGDGDHQAAAGAQAEGGVSEHQHRVVNVFQDFRADDMGRPPLDRLRHAFGGKLVGAGSGGFLLFYCPDKPRLRAAMASEDLQEMGFAFDFDGSTLQLRK